MTTSDDSTLMASDLPFENRIWPYLRKMWDGDPVRRIRTPTGDEAWLVSGHAEIRELLSGNRLGRSHPTPDDRATYAGVPAYDSVLSEDHHAADAMHDWVRKALRPHFTNRRMQAMRPRVEQLVEEGIDQLVVTGPPAELNTEFSTPLVLRLLCELLGVPADEQQDCLGLMSRADAGEPAEFFDYVTKLASRKCTAREDKIIPRMASTAGIKAEHIGHTALLLLDAGLHAITKQIALQVLVLAYHPDQRAALVKNPDLVPQVVEESLRISGSASLPRYAREDIELGGVTIGANELVLLDLTLANFDERTLAEANRFDPERSPNHHLTFGHGGWACLGAPLARLVLQSVLASLVTRLPALCPVDPTAKPEARNRPLGGGLANHFYVTW
jgi:cytochrome P450 monooxygenase